MLQLSSNFLNSKNCFNDIFKLKIFIGELTNKRTEFPTGGIKKHRDIALALQANKMETTLIGKVVTMQKFVETLTRFGFKHYSMRNSLILTYPFLPEKFKDWGLEIVFGPRAASPLVQIKDVKFMKKGNPSYKEVKAPDPEFDKYVSGFVQQALTKAMPMYIRQMS